MTYLGPAGSTRAEARFKECTKLGSVSYIMFVSISMSVLILISISISTFISRAWRFFVWKFVVPVLSTAQQL